MTNRPVVTEPNWWIVAVVLLAIVAGVVAVLTIDRSGERDRGLSERFGYHIDKFKKVDPALIRYEQRGEISCPMQMVRAVATGPGDRVYVAGDEGIHVFDPGGAPVSKIALEGKPTCLAVGGAGHAFPERVYAGLDRRVAVIDSEGEPAGTWDLPGKKGPLTSIAAAKDDVFVADYPNHIVLRYDTSGKLAGRIGAWDKEQGTPGLVIPSPFFDVAVDPGGRLWVVNPGALRVECRSFEGRLERFWKAESSPAIADFFGCCNPANLAILPDGRFVTAEKGLLRVKIYSAEGQFECVVAGPEQLEPPPPIGDQGVRDTEYTAVDVAVDSKGRVLILDLAAARVRIFERKEPATGAEDERD